VRLLVCLCVCVCVCARSCVHLCRLDFIVTCDYPSLHIYVMHKCGCVYQFSCAWPSMCMFISSCMASVWFDLISIQWSGWFLACMQGSAGLCVCVCVCVCYCNQWMFWVSCRSLCVCYCNQWMF